MRLRLPFGHEWVSAQWARGHCLGVLDIADVPALQGGDEALRQAMEHPIGLDASIFNVVKPGESVAILVSDAFRKTCADLVLPVLIDGLCAADVREEDICIVFATGTHRGPGPDEEVSILGQGIAERFAGRIFCHDPRDKSNLVYVGTTSRGTRVELNRRVCESDRVIATGAVVLHYFGGFGGGRKSIVPGIASVDTISHNHAMNLDPEEDRLDPNVRIGRMDGNPVAEDMLEAARLLKVDAIVNTVLNRDGDMAGVFAGELEAAHRSAADFARKLFSVSITQRADLVIAASAATKNYVQTHKALFNAYQAVKPEGRIILVAKCPEGLGGEQFVQWVRLGSPEAIIARLREQSEINGQTALSTLQKTPITIMVTDLTQEETAMLGARKADNLEDALELAARDLEAQGVTEPTCYVMPSAACSVPFATPDRKG